MKVQWWKTSRAFLMVLCWIWVLFCWCISMIAIFPKHSCVCHDGIWLLLRILPWHSIVGTILAADSFTTNYIDSYCCEFLRHLYLEPVCPVLWWLKPPKQQGLLQSRQRAQFGFQLYMQIPLLAAHVDILDSQCKGSRCFRGPPQCRAPPQEIRPTIKGLLTHWFPFIRPNY